MPFRGKLKRNAAFLQIPIGLESKTAGIIDIITRKALYFEGGMGQNIVEKEIPQDLQELAEEKRMELIGKYVLFCKYVFCASLILEISLDNVRLTKMLTKFFCYFLSGFCSSNTFSFAINNYPYE